MDLLFTLMPVVIIGGMFYYLVIYRRQARHNRQSPKSQPIALTFTAVAIAITLLATTVLLAPPKLNEVPLSKVIEQANNGELKRIEVQGDRLTITRRGDTKPSQQSRIEPGSSLHQQGLNSKNVEINIRPK